MNRMRVIPALLLHGKSLVKTRRFGKFDYIGDPANTVRIFNELEVDELFFLDIKASRTGAPPNFKTLQDVATECFIPMGYGGGIRDFDTAKHVFDTGFEKVILGSITHDDPTFVTQISTIYGTQATVVAIDVRKGLWGGTHLRSRGLSRIHRVDPVVWAREMEARGAGELLLTAIDREGTYTGFDLDLIAQVNEAVGIPVTAHGGAASLRDIRAARVAGASAVALGSLVMFQKRGAGVLINFPSQEALRKEVWR